MKFSVATIAVLATAAAAQYGQPQQPYGQQPQQPQQGIQQGQYQQPYYAPAPVQNKYSPAEYQAWHKCVDGLLDGFNVGHEGSKAGCAFWTCLENTAGQYSRGGALASLGSVVNKVCLASGILPGNWF
ncbi:hypothetical protein VF21_03722 [Pseudogymnoascus sp. 05NY08]|nr:hypothetical protein VF21_03722 [Pseudogymnoascus sp. 05NY08]